MRKDILAAVVVAVLVILGGALYALGWYPHTARKTPVPPSTQTNTATTGTSTDSSSASTSANTASGTDKKAAGTAATQPKTAPSIAERYCAHPQKTDTKTLADAGGLIQIFEHAKTVKKPYRCAKAYLADGGDIDAADPRKSSDGLTPLLYAIQQNDLKMTRFMLKHGADPNKRGGKQNIRPYGYAIFQALGHRKQNFNPVIAALNSALEKKTKSTGGS